MKKNSEILSYFPNGWEPRQAQADVLRKVESVWKTSDVIVVNAPVALGKSLIALTISKWQGGKADILVPTNILLKQYLRDVPAWPKMMKKEQYSCKERPDYVGEKEHYSCEERYFHSSAKKSTRKHCPECPFVKDNRRFRYARGVLETYMMYVARNEQRNWPASTVIVDEAHNLADTIMTLQGKVFWRHDLNYPENLYTRGQLLKWVKRRLADRFAPSKDKLEWLRQELEAPVPRYAFERSFKDFRGVPKDCIRLLPVNIRNAPPYFWGKGVKKLVLLSATISKEDIRQLGLDGRRVTFVNADSPIPVGNRKIIAESIANVNYRNSNKSIKEITEYIREVLLPKHQGEKGVLHATYALLPLLKKELRGPQFVFHDSKDKMKKYQEFLDSPPEDGKVFVACGLQEGIDLKDDRARWQAVVKVPWLSLGDPAIREKVKNEETYYRWQALKDILQASGRVCRGPDDYGVTYILDSSFERLYDNSRDLTPAWFSEALVRRRKSE